MIKIYSDRLEVEVMEPGEGRNRTARFDRSGFVSQVRLDGRYRFCCDEPGTGETGGAGLCSEIRCSDTYARCRPGQRFAKFGVGMLLKEEEQPYDFMKEYDCLPFPVEVDAGESSARFTVMAEETDGCGLYLEKLLTVQDNRVTMEYRYSNIGSRSLRLEEYCHNFLTIEGRPIGYGYCLDMPAICSQEGKRSVFGSGTMVGTETGFCFLAEEPKGSLLTVGEEEINPAIPFSWRLSHQKSDCRVTGRVSFVPAKVDIWSEGNIVAPEVIHRFCLDPGRDFRYRRQWIFSSKEE